MAEAKQPAKGNESADAPTAAEAPKAQAENNEVSALRALVEELQLRVEAAEARPYSDVLPQEVDDYGAERLAVTAVPHETDEDGNIVTVNPKSVKIEDAPEDEVPLTAAKHADGRIHVTYSDGSKRWTDAKD